MADEPETPETNDTPPEPKPDPEPPAKDEPDWKAEARKWEKRAKDNSDAAARLKELEDAQKTEQEKLTENLSAAEKRAQEAELRALRIEVASDKGLTKAQAKYLTGTTEEELSEAADELLQLFAQPEEDPDPRRRPKERLRPGATPASEPDIDPKQLAEDILGGP
jgi:hypothetical protein